MKNLIAVIGQEAASLLAEEYRGTNLYIPKPNNIHSHRIAKLIGAEAAMKLAQMMSGESLYIEMGRTQLIQSEVADGATVETITQRFNVSPRTAYRHKKILRDKT